MALDTNPLAETSTFDTPIYGPLPNSKVEAADVSNGLQRLANRTKFINEQLIATKREVFTFAEEGAAPTYVIGPPNLFSSATFVDSKITVDVTGCAIGDDIEIEAWGDWQLNTASAPEVVGRARIGIIEDVNGTPVVAPSPTGKATIATPGGGSLPHISNYSINAKHRITSPGDARVTLQVAYEDLSAMSGTATVILQLSARMDVVKYRRS